MQGDDIAVQEYFFQRNIANGVAVVQPGRGELVISQHLHAEAPADIDKDLADLSGTDDAHSLAM